MPRERHGSRTSPEFMEDGPDRPCLRLSPARGLESSGHLILGADGHYINEIGRTVRLRVDPENGIFSVDCSNS